MVFVLSEQNITLNEFLGLVKQHATFKCLVNSNHPGS